MSVTLTKQLWDLMSPEDQAKFPELVRLYGGGPAPDPKLEVHPPVKSGGSEKAEQGSFANWLLLQNSKRSEDNQIPFEWHPTHTRSKTTPGCGDFWVGINGISMWFEFKRDYSCELSAVQEKFRLACQAQRIRYHVVYSAFQAIKIVERADQYMDPRERTMPDWSTWTTSRLKVLLHEYEDSLPGIRVMYGKSQQGREEEALFQRWIAAISEELAKRGASS